jgi:hypothetical protein
MVFLYTFLVSLLGLTRVLLQRRATSLEKKHSRVAHRAAELAREPVYKGGSNSKLDPYLIAKRQYELGQLVQQRDRLEVRYDIWQHRADKVQKLSQAIRGWQGKKLPYTLGVLDVSGALYLIDYLGVGEYVNPRHLVQLLTSLIPNG